MNKNMSQEEAVIYDAKRSSREIALHFKNHVNNIVSAIQMNLGNHVLVEGRTATTLIDAEMIEELEDDLTRLKDAHSIAMAMKKEEAE